MTRGIPRQPLPSGNPSPEVWLKERLECLLPAWAPSPCGSPRRVHGHRTKDTEFRGQRCQRCQPAGPGPKPSLGTTMEAETEQMWIVGSWSELATAQRPQDLHEGSQRAAHRAGGRCKPTPVSVHRPLFQPWIPSQQNESWRQEPVIPPAVPPTEASGGRTQVTVWPTHLIPFILITPREPCPSRS